MTYQDDYNVSFPEIFQNKDLNFCPFISEFAIFDLTDIYFESCIIKWGERLLE